MKKWLHDCVALFGSTRLIDVRRVDSISEDLVSPEIFGERGVSDYFITEVSRQRPRVGAVCVYENLILHWGDVHGLGLTPCFPGHTEFIPGDGSSIHGELNFDQTSIVDDPCSLYSYHHSAQNYYHLLIDYAAYAGSLGVLYPNRRPVVATSSVSSFHEEVRRSIIQRDWLLLPLKTSYLLKNVAIQSMMTKGDVVDYLRSSSTKIAAGATKRLYISRERATNRRVLNQDEIDPVLESFGFEKIFCEDLSLEDQIALFKGAEIVCGPHGAGLANLAFCAAGTKVIEFFLQERLPLSAVFWRIGCAAHLDYKLVVATRVQNEADPQAADGHLIVDPARLLEALRSCL